MSLNQTKFQKLISYEVLSTDTDYTNLDDILTDVIEFLQSKEDINETASDDQWITIFEFVEENINELNVKALIEYFKVLFDLRFKHGITLIEGKMCHEHLIKKYQLLIYNNINKQKEGDAEIILEMFGVYTDLFLLASNIKYDDPENTEKLLFILDVYKSVISLIISTYGFIVSSDVRKILKQFYNIWKIVDLLLVSLNDQLESTHKKNIIISLEYLINKFFNNLVEIDTNAKNVDGTLSVFLDLLNEEKKSESNDTFFLKLVDNYLLFNIDNILKVFNEFDESFDQSKLYDLFNFLFNELKYKHSYQTEDYRQLLTHIVLNCLQTIVANMNMQFENEETENKKSGLLVQNLVKNVVKLLSLNDFSNGESVEMFYKVLLNIVNDYGYIIADFDVWILILKTISENISSATSKLLLKAIVTNDDILNNLNLENIKTTILLIEQIILDNICKEDLDVDDNLLLNYFNYFWNINDYLNSFYKTNFEIERNKEFNTGNYYSCWNFLFDSLFQIFEEISKEDKHQVLKISVLTMYFNLINNSLVIVNEESYTTSIKQTMIVEKILNNSIGISECFLQDQGVLDLILKELLVLLPVNQKSYLNFYKNMIDIANKNGNNDVLYVLMKNYHKCLEKCLAISNLDRQLIIELYQIWLGYDFSVNNESIINEIKNTKTENKSQYDLVSEYMKIYPFINTLLSRYKDVYKESTETNLQIIDKCLKFPILPNSNGKDENNLTMLQRYCLNNIKLMMDTADDVTVIEKLSDILHYKTIIKQLISEKIFSKLPEKLSHRLPTFKRLSYEALLVLNEYFEKSSKHSKVVVKNLLETIKQKDVIKTAAQDSVPMWVLSSKILISLVDIKKDADKKVFLLIFNTILEDQEQSHENVINLYILYSELFFANLKNLSTEVCVFNKVCFNLIKIIVRKEFEPLYIIFSEKILKEEIFNLNEFDEDNLWLLLIEKDVNESCTLFDENLIHYVSNDLTKNIDNINELEGKNDVFLKLINLDLNLKLKYHLI
ncbi:hypothetical protein QEN19_004045 [Hanseniaspora menglaensis]